MARPVGDGSAGAQGRARLFWRTGPWWLRRRRQRRSPTFSRRKAHCSAVCTTRERGATVRFDCVAAISPLLERRRRLTTGSSRRAPRTAQAKRRSRRSRLAGLKKRARELAPRSPRPDHLPAQPVLARPRRPRRSDAGTIVLSNSDLGGRSRFANSAVGSCFFGSCLALQ